MFAFDGVSIPPEQWGALRFVPALTINRWAIRLLYDGVVENYQPPADGDAAAEERRRHAYAMMLGPWRSEVRNILEVGIGSVDRASEANMRFWWFAMSN